MQHIEMIIDYVTDGTDYQYCDNHGVLIRCKDCKHWEQESICEGYCSEIEMGGFDEDHFCSYAERQEDG